eukprot:6081870-Prorocentrum_lima.AAC.1
MEQLAVSLLGELVRQGAGRHTIAAAAAALLRTATQLAAEKDDVAVEQHLEVDARLELVRPASAAQLAGRQPGSERLPGVS